MRVALAQINPTIGALHGNALKIAGWIQKARREGATLVVFPELAVTGYPPRDLLYYESFLQEAWKRLEGVILPQTAGIAVLLGMPCPDPDPCAAGRLYNSALLLCQGAICSVHHKTLLPNYDVFDESRYFRPAPARHMLEFEGRKIAVTICEDAWNDKDYWERQRYSEDPVEELFRQGAEMLLNISASPYHVGKAKERERMLCSLAAKYRAPVFYVNQVGGNDELIFDGSSLTCSAEGRVVQRAAPFEEELLLCCLEGRQPALEGERTSSAPVFAAPAPSEAYGIAERPFTFAGTPSVYRAVGAGFEERGIQAALERPAKEEGAAWIFAALQLGLRDYLRKTGFQKVVVGLSGGIDSALTAALAAAALGPEAVLGVLMPSPYSSRGSVDDSLALAKNLGIEVRQIPIDEPFQAFVSLMNGKGPLQQDLAEENIQARIRGSLLMFISNRERRLVLATGNKSELAVGYCTLYGDMAGGLSVLADLPKCMVYELAAFINARSSQKLIPDSIIQKAPSAELRPDQRDEDSLPPYEVLDRILYHYIEENKHVEEITALGFEREAVREIIQKVDRAEYKRHQAPPGLRVTTRAFGGGRRMPIACIPHHENTFYNS